MYQNKVMKRLCIPRVIIYNSLLILLLIIVNISTISCNNEEKENNDAFFKIEPTKVEPTIDFNLIINLNESNKKTISLATFTFSQTKDVKTFQLLLKIKKDHQKIDSELKKLTENNLIIIPKLDYQMNLNSDSLNEKKTDLYLLKILDKEINKQAMVFDSIEKDSQNTDFKIFAIKSRKILKENNEVLKTLLTD